MKTSKKVALVVGLGLVGFVAYRVLKAVRVGASVVSALRHPTMDVQAAQIADQPPKTRTGSGAF